MKLLRVPLLWLACWLLPLLAWAQASAPPGALLPVPALTARVMDQTGTLSGAQRDALERKLAAFEASQGTQIVLLLVPSTQPEDIAAYAFRVADAWKIGRRSVGDGLLLLVAKNDHRARIEVARALEGAVPDVIAGRIISGTLAPAFKAGDYAGGLDQAVDQLMARVQQGGAQAAPAQPGGGAPVPESGVATGSSGGSDIPSWVLAFGLGVLAGMVLLRAVLGPFPAALLMGGIAGVGGGLAAGLQVGLMAAVGVGLVTLIGLGNVLLSVLSNMGGGGGGGGSGGGGGGFSSGGGGSFGGGGASGSW
jgi:uncharacterized protein